jgi:hypothetical protein
MKEIRKKTRPQMEFSQGSKELLKYQLKRKGVWENI